MNDMLRDIFSKQLDLQIKLDTFPKLMDEQYIKDMTLATIVELTEVLNETPWKPWKKHQILNREKYIEEMVDVLHFYVNLCIVADITPDLLYKKYMEKNNTNIQRKKEGY